MVNDDITSKIVSMNVKQGLPTYLQKLILKGFLNTPVTTPEILKKIKNTYGRAFRPTYISTYMKPFMENEIVKAINIPGERGNRWCISNLSERDALARINLTRKEVLVAEQLFSDTLMKNLNKDFKTETEDLHLVFGKSGNCTAFLLRKILEKLIYLTFAKNNLLDELKDANGNIVGLKTMLDKATKHKVRGIHFLTPNTAKEIKGIKFLGDTSAHNPLANVDMKTIMPQMPFIITAFEELSKKL